MENLKQIPNKRQKDDSIIIRKVLLRLQFNFCYHISRNRQSYFFCLFLNSNKYLKVYFASWLSSFKYACFNSGAFFNN